ncbi:MAG: hypothetical protein PUG48_01295 [Clostridia bacterium]|nr:hypothetical protein [Clostridia bacterium]
MENVNKFQIFIADSEENKRLIQKENKCDIADYLVAVACGAVGGLVDIFLVGTPTDSVLGKWTDAQVDKAVMNFAGMLGWNPKEKNIHNVNSAIGYLEKGRTNGFRGFKVNYDQRKPTDVNNLFNIAPKTHHMMSLAHSPDIVGLFFSILNQFTSTSSFVANGKLITVATDTFELRGGNFLMKIMCGIANWFGHLMSDVAGSSGSHKRGTGIVMPFYEFFGFCKSGNFSTQNGTKALSEIAMQAFTQGYDFRFGLTQMIPVVITELSIRLIWSLRQHFQYNKPIKDCIPTEKHNDLRMMLLLGNGILCVMDGVDAAIRSNGDTLNLFMHLNLIAWFRLIMLVFKEIFIRLGIKDKLQMEIDAFKRINVVLQDYLKELEKIDIELFKKETNQYNNFMVSLNSARNEKDLNLLLLNIYDELGIKKPWQGDFDQHMSDKNGTLVFE